MKKNRFISAGSFNKSAREKLHLENEKLRMRLKTEIGGEIKMEGKKLPLNVENLFLKNILDLEKNYARAPLVSMYEFLGCPAFKKAAEIDEEDIEKALEGVLDFLFNRNIIIDFTEMEDPREKYAFITEEFFAREVGNLRVPGVFFRFQLEGRRTDHNQDIRKVGKRFVTDWFDRTMGVSSGELGEEFILEDGTVMSRKQVLEKFRLMFEAYTDFQHFQYVFNETKYEFKGSGVRGVGLVNGYVKYDAILESGDIQHFEGPFIVFMSLDKEAWRVFYFVFPGFEW